MPMEEALEISVEVVLVGVEIKVRVDKEMISD